MTKQKKIIDSGDTDLRPCPECGQLTKRADFVEMNGDAVCENCQNIRDIPDHLQGHHEYGSN